VLREYLVSEAMAALGVPTTRALAAVTTGERVMRETILPGAILTRVAASHLRVGTFEYFAARRDNEGLRMLADYAMERHYAEARAAEKPYGELLRGVIARQAQLVAQWMLLGFIHGVMNTDNTSISGETIDFGPCAFMEAYDPATVFSFIDQQGRYAFGNQPRMTLWNLTRLAEALLPLLVEEAGGEEAALAIANEALSTFAPQYEAAHLAGMRRKMGLFTEQDGDKELAQDLLERMAASRADFTLTFRRLGDAAEDAKNDEAVRLLFVLPSAYDAWAVQWRERLRLEPEESKVRAGAMRAVNPVFIPRNHMVEGALKAAIEERNFQPFEMLLGVVTNPFEDREDFEPYAKPALPDQRVERTYCGT
jgi:uncharacterized protein YdiU (UPF0061 family)